VQKTLAPHVNKTLKHPKGTQKMKNEELLAGFDTEQQARHEQYLIKRYGADMRQSIAQSRTRN